MFASKKVRSILAIGFLMLLLLLAMWMDTGAQYPAYANGNDEKQQVAPSKGFYVVAPGDTLYAIAQSFGMGPDELSKYNQLSSGDFIVVGQVLQIPDAQIHQVVSGETLWSIGKDYGVSVEQLIQCNRIADGRFLKAGENLLIPVATEKIPTPGAEPVVPEEKMIWPVMGWISSPFGEREGRLHKGLDLAANMGYPILAVQKGVVTYADEMGTYGLMVTVDHGNGLETVYAHAASLLVQKGESVEQGQVIALVGSTGRSTGPHLHLEVRVNGKQVNPLLFLANTKV